jgi:UDP-2,3-diacylglucosamine pyrophosphatase LpxH
VKYVRLKFEVMRYIHRTYRILLHRNNFGGVDQDALVAKVLLHISYFQLLSSTLVVHTAKKSLTATQTIQQTAENHNLSRITRIRNVLYEMIVLQLATLQV